MRAPTPKSRWVKAPVRDSAAALSGRLLLAGNHRHLIFWLLSFE
jgi:hypothetical protein